jgi:hypothetical protein
MASVARACWTRYISVHLRAHAITEKSLRSATAYGNPYRRKPGRRRRGLCKGRCSPLAPDFLAVERLIACCTMSSAYVPRIPCGGDCVCARRSAHICPRMIFYSPPRPQRAKHVDVAIENVYCGLMAAVDTSSANITQFRPCNALTCWIVMVAYPSSMIQRFSLRAPCFFV